MKIKARQIKPGMVIDKKYKNDHDYMLVTAVKGYKEVECTHFNHCDGYMGRLIGFYDGKEEVRVVTNKKKRDKIIKDILGGVFRLLHDAEDNVALIKLIQTMSTR